MGNVPPDGNAWSSNFDCQEIYDSQKTTITLDSIECEVKLQCAWADRYGLMMDLLGMYDNYTTNDPDPSLFNPTYWPYFWVEHSSGRYISDTNDGTINLFDPPVCHHVSISPLDGIGFPYQISQTGQKNPLTSGPNTLRYNQAILTVKFSTHQEPVLVSEEIEWSTQILKMPSDGFYWKTTQNGKDNWVDLRPEEAPGQFIHGGTIHRTLYRQPQIFGGYDYLTSIGELIGSVNQATWTSDVIDVDFAPETLLFLPATTKRTLCLNGDPGWNIALKLAWNPNTWNKFLRRATNAWEHMYRRTQGGVYRPFPKADLSKYLY